MKVKETKVSLIAGKTREDFEIRHAERILRMQNNGGWKLPLDSEYKLDKKHGLIPRTNKRGPKKPEEEAGNS